MTKGKVDVVLGASGGCGKACVERLLEQGGQVRAVGRVSPLTNSGSPPRLVSTSTTSHSILHILSRSHV
jgi:NAD(P)-dependent dehydrogenase (short-subunit alcohol dehydrogenase family)